MNHDDKPTLPPTRPLAILDADGRPLWAALWRAGQRPVRGTVVQLRLFEEEKS